MLRSHRLSKLPRHVGVGGEQTVSEDWENAHRLFHASLVAACGSTWLIQYCEQLFDAAERYRNLSRLRRPMPPRRKSDEHRLIVDAVIARNAPVAIKLLLEHFAHTAELVRQSLNASSEHRPPLPCKQAAPSA